MLRDVLTLRPFRQLFAHLHAIGGWGLWALILALAVLLALLPYAAR